MHEHWTDQMSGYLDGELDAARRAALEAHLRECEECRNVLAGLEQVVAMAVRAPALPPGRDLWEGIAARLHPSGAAVIPLAGRRPRRRFSFTAPQLAAAALFVMLLGAGGLYFALQAGPWAPRPAARTDVAAPAPVRLASTSYDAHENAIAELEQALADNRARLDTATVRVLEQSIGTIDRAIDEARAALAQDPANPFLHRHLDGAMKKKIDILRRAVSVRRAGT